MLISSAYAQAAASSMESNLMSFLPLILMFVVLYFIILRPQIKRQKEVKNMLGTLAKGDEVITAGGLLGKLTKITEQYVSIELAENVEVQVQKAAITAVLPKGTLKSI